MQKNREIYGNERSRFDGGDCDKMRKRQLIGVPIRFPFSEIYTDGFGRGNAGKCSVNALAYDSEIRRWRMDGGLFSETVMYGEKRGTTRGLRGRVWLDT